MNSGCKRLIHAWGVLLFATLAVACSQTNRASQSVKIVAVKEPLTNYPADAYPMVRLRPLAARNVSALDKMAYVDILAPEGTPVLSPADGKINFVGVDPVYGGSRGIKMSVDTSTYPVYLRLWNLDEIAVTNEEHVKAGQRIGTVAASQDYIFRYDFETRKNAVLRLPVPQGYLRIAIRGGPARRGATSNRNPEHYFTSESSSGIECADIRSVGDYPKARFYKVLSNQLQGPRLLYPVACTMPIGEPQIPDWIVQ